MQKFLMTLFAALIVAMGVTATPAMAQATRTWVSGVGDDANPCSRTAPCKTFAGAISKTAAAGEINCLDSGGFGAVTITKSLTIRCIGVEGGVLVSGTSGIIVNAATTDRVVLQGLDIEGLGTSIDGIRILSARDVVVLDCRIHDFSSATSGGIHLKATGASRLTVSNTSLIGNTMGVNIDSSDGASAAKLFDNIFVANTQAAITVSNAGNRATLSNNSVTGSRGLQLLGGTATTFSNNPIDAPTDTATPIPLS